MPYQEALTVIAIVRPGQEVALRTILGAIKDHVESWNAIRFSELKNLHFARLFLISDSAEPYRPTQLVFTTDIDSPLDQHIRDLASVCGNGLDQVFNYCEGYPEESDRNPETRSRFLTEHRINSAAVYVNQQGRTVEQILQEERLRHQIIDEHLSKLDFSSQSPDNVRKSIIDFVSTRADLRWALSPAQKPSLRWQLKESFHGISVLIAAIALAPIILGFLPIFIVLLRFHEKREKSDTSSADSSAIQDFRDDEDFWPQNQIIAGGYFKPGLFRYITGRTVLWMTDYACRHIYNKGVLSGLNTIHFARWVPIDGGRRLFFSSNYDGSLESYMSDFIDKAAWGLNAIFSNGEGFPRTSCLFCGGIMDEQAYKRFLPTRQIKTQVWYSAYPHLTVKNILNNAEIRKGLTRSLNEEEQVIWLGRFGYGNQRPLSGPVARILDGIRWEKICRHLN
jgi:hypothetical protein